MQLWIYLKITYCILKARFGRKQNNWRERQPQISSLSGRPLHQPLVLFLPPPDVFPKCPSSHCALEGTGSQVPWRHLLSGPWHAPSWGEHGPGMIQLKKRNTALVGEKEKKRKVIKKMEISQKERCRHFLTLKPVFPFSNVVILFFFVDFDPVCVQSGLEASCLLRPAMVHESVV